ncbi:hypothetical protein [Embleya sp. NPDC059237]|uniref:hypothetical protein n=1 Tax=Embleya sp. NPDC059237 TaxID=3346784 RepID=UPI0036A0EA1B
MYDVAEDWTPIDGRTEPDGFYMGTGHQRPPVAERPADGAVDEHPDRPEGQRRGPRRGCRNDPESHGDVYAARHIEATADADAENESSFLRVTGLDDPPDDRGTVAVVSSKRRNVAASWCQGRGKWEGGGPPTEGLAGLVVEVVTPHDPEARFCRKAGKAAWVGYRARPTETCDTGGSNVIVYVATAPAPEQDIEALDDIHTAPAARRPAPPSTWSTPATSARRRSGTRLPRTAST